MRRVSLFAGWFALSVVACTGSSTPVATAPGRSTLPFASAKASDGLARGLAALDASRYADAERLLADAAKGKDAGRALVALSDVQRLTGRYALAAETAERASKVDPGTLVEARVRQASALRLMGKLDAAEASLRTVSSQPDAQSARLLLGEVLLDRGRRADAEPVLMTLVKDYNDDKVKDEPGLARVGRAAYLLRHPEDAQDALNEAERAGTADVQTLLWWADLALDEYDPGTAEKVLGEILQRAPNHPLANVAMAQVKLDQALDFDEATRYANKALAVDPKLARAHFVLAGIALRDEDLEAAERSVQAGLAADPADLPLLSLHAAVRYLADDDKGFAAAKDAVFKLNPEYSELYNIVGEYADWEHRYAEIVQMMHEALALDPDNAKARAQLGLNLIRDGNDQDGLTALRRAFSLDGYNVRVFNTLNLYEKQVIPNYVSVNHPLFTIRYPKTERDILERYLPAMLERAWNKFVGYYSFTPTHPVGVELYDQRKSFAVRTSGLPQTVIQGVCFGKTLAAMSLAEEHFNLGMTLWHELAHVFHIQLSRSRVPRWFTEGLAEYETLVERPEWVREQDPSLYSALRAGRLPAVASMSRAFTRAEELDDVATAYYASTRIVVMIGESWGRPKLDQMLELWGKGKSTTDVIRTALGIGPDELDQRFRKYAEKRLERYAKQFVPLDRTGRIEDAQAAAEHSPKDARVQTVYALALLKKGDLKQAAAQLTRALTVDPSFADARFLTARIGVGTDKVADALKLLDNLKQDGHDGFAVEMLRAQAFGSQKNIDGTRAALEAATRFDPSEAEPLQGLLALADQQQKSDEGLEILRKLAMLTEHDPVVYRQLLTRLVDRGRFAEVLQWSDAALYADLEGFDTHRAIAEANRQLGKRPEAIFELESALLCPNAEPAKLAEAHRRLAELYKDAGQRDKVKEHTDAAEKLESAAPPAKL